MTLGAPPDQLIGKRYSPEIVLIVSVGLCFAMAAISAAIGLDVASARSSWA